MTGLSKNGLKNVYASLQHRPPNKDGKPMPSLLKIIPRPDGGKNGRTTTDEKFIQFDALYNLPEIEADAAEQRENEELGGERQEVMGFMRAGSEIDPTPGSKIDPAPKIDPAEGSKIDPTPGQKLTPPGSESDPAAGSKIDPPVNTRSINTHKHMEADPGSKSDPAPPSELCVLLFKSFQKELQGLSSIKAVKTSVAASEVELFHKIVDDIGFDVALQLIPKVVRYVKKKRPTTARFAGSDFAWEVIIDQWRTDKPSPPSPKPELKAPVRKSDAMLPEWTQRFDQLPVEEQAQRIEAEKKKSYVQVSAKLVEDQDAFYRVAAIMTFGKEKEPKQ